MTHPDDSRDLFLELELSAPRVKVWRCWTEPELLKQWFAPAPWTTPHAEIDVRPGGHFLVVMRSPEGEDQPSPGVILEVEEGRRMVMSDAYVDAWTPSQNPFMTVILTLDEMPDGGTLYRVRVRHWSDEDRSKHEEMGFHEGWTTCGRQLEALARSL